ncbi:Glycosyltransferase involved in cell wall bisynthesis [Maribacter sedimenticola]|uniref:Glycosyltransferase involved in cell wall bisynthesis n=1 Tax=Maribacter sedimenticola TaxID=228956 RepID=A0ABY1SHR4_9FLAO|nr:glycosyltransferase [Maribacter sedimenticola]SNR47085.1 Glycosyltransferase involved in cell wall bisynthesis [Maribacter sedimenticola]
MNHSKSLLVIALVWPEPASTAAGVRMMQLLDVFKRDGYSITIASAASTSEHSADLESCGYKTKAIQMNDSSFDAFVAELNPDAVLFDRFLTEEQFGWRVAEQCPNALRILDTEDLHSLRHVRETCFKKGVEFTTDAWLQDDKTKREIASIYRCDLSLIISSYELELLTEVIKIDKSLLFLLPFMLPEIPEDKEWKTFDQRTDFLFIGGGKHAPNIDAVKCLKHTIWPLLRERLPEAKLHIYGAYLPQQVVEMDNQKERFFVKGRAADVNQVMAAAKVCLAPLRFGAGIKGKLVAAMANGTPSVTTTIGAEGMYGILEWNGYIENDHTAFVEAAVRLYTVPTAWNKAQEQGKTLINTLYSETSQAHLLLQKVTELQTGLQHHRTQNFIGGLLQHQTMSATKFMGKWIEEKNKG